MSEARRRLSAAIRDSRISVFLFRSLLLSLISGRSSKVLFRRLLLLVLLCEGEALRLFPACRPFLNVVSTLAISHNTSTLPLPPSFPSCFATPLTKTAGSETEHVRIGIESVWEMGRKVINVPWPRVYRP